MKTCTKCKETKDLSAFDKQSRGKNGLKSQCKKCHLDYKRYLYNSDPGFRERMKKNSNNWSLKNLEKRRESARKYTSNPIIKTRRKDYLLKLKYGISLQDKEALIKKQNYLCAICQRKLLDRNHVDHCHKTNVIRGVLCNNCNTGIGLFKENKDTFLNAIKYLNL